jgi:acyl carrier protein
MQSTPQELVCHVLAEHLDVEANTIQPNQSLENDLDLTPLAFVLVVLDLEDSAHMYLPLDEWMAARTVSDLARLVVEGRVGALAESGVQIAHVN